MTSISGGAPRPDPPRRMPRAGLIIALMTVLAGAVGQSWAQSSGAYPERPVRLVVGFAPGGSDISGRIIAQKLSGLWGQNVIVDNKPGASGNIGADIVSKAPADGYTLLLTVNSYTINTVVYRNLGWDLLRDFEPLGRYATSPMVVVINDQIPARTMGELVAYARAHPDRLNYGTAGAGTAPHLAVEQFAHLAGLAMTHVPYKGSAPSVQALIANEVQLSFGAQSAFDAFIKAGKLRSLAVTTANRQVGLPDVPTIKEAVGVDFDADIWYGLVAPVRTPAAIVGRISDDLQKVLNDPDTQARLRGAGVVPAYLNSVDMGALMQRDVARWREVAQRIRLTLN